MLTKPTPTEFEEAVLQALHWYADAWLQPSLDNELLGLVTALETFFTRGRGMTGQIAEGVAFVEYSGLPPDDLLSARKHVVERVRLLYNLRGTVTHGRQSSDPAGRGRRAPLLCHQRDQCDDPKSERLGDATGTP